MKTLIMIPAYNEAENIERVVENLIQNYPQYDYVVIDDCSKDTTAQICQKRGFHYLQLPINLGIGGGVQAGYLYAKQNGYDVAIQMDGDGQHNPEYIAVLLEPIVAGDAEIVIGSRFIEKAGFQSSALRRFGIKFLQVMIQCCCGATATDSTSGFRAASKPAIAFFADNYAHDYPEPEAIVSAVLSNLKVQEVSVEMNERQGGVSSISGLKSAYYMVKVSLALLVCRLSYGKRRS